MWRVSTVMSAVCAACVELLVPVGWLQQPPWGSAIDFEVCDVVYCGALRLCVGLEMVKTNQALKKRGPYTLQ